MAFDAVVLKVSNEEHIFFIFRAEVSLTMGGHRYLQDIRNHLLHHTTA
jgi:hypothetical protein